MLIKQRIKPAAGSTSLTKLAICLALGSLTTLPAIAGLITIQNSSFEEPVAPSTGPTTGFTTGTTGNTTAVTHWNIVSSGTGSAGVSNPSLLTGYSGTPPAGNQVGYINGDFSGANGTTSISQQLGTALAINTQYTLRVAVVGRSNGGPIGTGYAIGLYAGGNADGLGGTLLSGITPVPPPTTGSGYQYISTTFTTGSDLGALSGDLLDVEISVPGTGTTFEQLSFDDISLDAEPVPTAEPVPEASPLIDCVLLMLPASASVLRMIRRRQLAGN